MATTQQLATYFANNKNISVSEIDLRIKTYGKQCYEEGCSKMHRKLININHKRKELFNNRLRDEWNAILEKLRDDTTKKNKR